VLTRADLKEDGVAEATPGTHFTHLKAPGVIPPPRDGTQARWWDEPACLVRVVTCP